MKKYNLSNIMKRAWELVKKAGRSISSALKQAWKEAKDMANTIKNVVIAHYESYNANRYSTPWVCKMEENGKHNFSEEVGTYTGNRGDEGNLVIFEPVAGQLYGYGQKDYRGANTEKKYIRWTGSEFVACDKLGNLIK